MTTTGYGNRQGGSDEDEWYTNSFSGTSSASPMVVGALGCVQGYLQARGRSVLTPLEARGHLRVTGSPQQDAPGRPATQRIGNRPNLRSLLAQVKGDEQFNDRERKKKNQDFGGMPRPLERLARLEGTVEQLLHFIGSEFRPELRQPPSPMSWTSS